MAMPDHASVDAYIAAQREDVRPKLKRLRNVIRAAVPHVQETISYRIPTYLLHGKPVVFFAAWKEHLSLYPATAAVFDAIPELLPLKHAKDTVRLAYGASLPVHLVARFAKVRAEEVEAAHRGAGSTPRKARAEARGETPKKVAEKVARKTATSRPR